MWDIIFTVSLLTKDSYHPFSSWYFLCWMKNRSGMKKKEMLLLLRRQKKKGGWEAERLQYVFGQRAPARACKGEGAISNGLLFRHIEKESDCDPGS